MNADIKRDIETDHGRMPPDAPTAVSDHGVRLRSDRIKILFIGVNDDAGQLRLGNEHRAIQRSLEQGPDRFAFDELLEVRIDELGTALRRRAPHILHFSGHGSRAGELVFQDGAGALSGISPDAFVSLLRTLGIDIKLAVLNACFSEQQARAISEITGITIGMRRQISDRAAIAFSRAFYGALADSESVLDAFRQAQAELGLQNETAGDATVPELFVRPGLDASRIHLPRVRAPVVAPPTEPQPPPLGPIRRPRRLWVVLLPLMAVAMAAALALWRSISRPDVFAIKVMFVNSARQSVKIAGTARLESEGYTPTVRVEGSDMVAFERVPQRLDGSDAGFTVDSSAFRVATPERRYPLRGDEIIVLELEPIATKFSGTVSFAGKPLLGGQVSLAGHDCSAPIRDGYFALSCANVTLPVKIRVREPESYLGRVCMREFELSEPTDKELALGPCPAPAAPSPSLRPAPSPSLRPTPPLSSPPLAPTPCARAPQELIWREAELVRQGDLAGVVALFAPGAMICDDLAGACRSPRDRYDDELRQHHFLTAMHGSIACDSADAGVTFCTSSSAGTFGVGSGYSNPAGSDRWVLEKQGTCWRIRSLTINAHG